MFYQNVCEPLLLNVRRYPDKTALVFGQERYTYGQLGRWVDRIAAGLFRLGIRPGDKVAYLFPNCCELVALYYAIQKLGAVAVPLNFRLNPREIGFLTQNSDAVALVFAGEFAEKVLGIRETLAQVKHFICAGTHPDFPCTLESLAQEAGEELPVFQREQALSRIQFTGGSTGVPKGVMRTHAADLTELMGELMYSGLGASADEVVLIQCPLEHHGGHSWFTAVLASGSTLVNCDAFSPERILRQIQRERVTYMLLLPPSTYLHLCEYPGLKDYDVSSVRMVQSSAGCTTPEVILRIGEAFPNADIYYGWGQTESGLGTTLVLTREMARTNDPRIRSVGRPMPFVEMRIVDEQWNDLPPGQAGEAVIRSPAGMSGYYNQPEQTEKVLRADGWLRTGDMMTVDRDGYYYLLSRVKNMIKSGGENVFTQEVEMVIQEHPSVAECIVIGVADARFGEAVMAIVQLRPGRTLTLEELQEHCKASLSSYKKPRYLAFVDKFDRDDAGKLRRQDLCRKYQAQYKAAVKAQRQSDNNKKSI